MRAIAVGRISESSGRRVMTATVTLVLAQVLGIACDVYTVIIFAGIVLSWIRFDPHHPFSLFIRQATEPVYDRIRRVVPTTFGMIDLAPLIVLVLVQVLRSVAQHLVVATA
jgi:YggT family protein